LACASASYGAQRSDEGRVMKIVGYHSTLRTAILGAVLSAGLAIAGHADEF